MFTDVVDQRGIRGNTSYVIIHNYCKKQQGTPVKEFLAVQLYAILSNYFTSAINTSGSLNSCLFSRRLASFTLAIKYL